MNSVKEKFTTGHAVIYCRVSTHEQAEGNSLDFQETACRKYADLNNLVVKRVYTDAGVSGRKEEREQYSSMRKEIVKGDTILIYSISRISRSTKDFLNLLEEFEKKGVILRSIKENLETNSAFGIFICTLLSSLAALEANVTRERCQDRIVRKLKKGEACSGEKYGYDSWRYDSSKPPRLIPNYDEQIAINEIIKMRKEGKALRKIIEYLNENNYKAKRGGEFKPETLRAVLVREYQMRVKKHGTEILEPDLIKEYVKLKMPLIVPQDQRQMYIKTHRDGTKEYDGNYEDDSIEIEKSLSYLSYGKDKKKLMSTKIFDKVKLTYDMKKELQAPRKIIITEEEYERRKLEVEFEQIIEKIYKNYRSEIFKETGEYDISRLRLMIQLRIAEQMEIYSKCNQTYIEDRDPELLKLRLKLLDAKNYA
jgi:DNA invertase Pin-like site-specific DNA recombinase